MSKPTILHIVDPTDRRSSLFAAAADTYFAVHVWPWTSVLAGDAPPIDNPTWVRLDPFGSHPELRSMLDINSRSHAVGDSHELYRSMTKATDRIESYFGPRTMLTSAATVATVFDKTACHVALDRAHVPVAPALSVPIDGVDDLIAELGNQAWGSAFVKPRYGSSASGVVALRQRRDPRTDRRQLAATTTAARCVHSNTWLNQVGLRTYRDDDAHELLTELLAAEPMHVERWLPKASVNGSTCDVRIVTINGQPCHRAVRGAAGPITNLHAGGRDISTGAFVEHIGNERWHQVLDTCAAVAQVFPDALYLGIDIAVSPRGSTHAVLEVNAFGDLLPRARWNDQTTYEVQVEALASGAFQQRQAELAGANV